MPTILLVDDDPDTRRMYGMYLRHLGYEVLEAEDGEAGVTLARERRPDVVLMDLWMPRLDGFAATRLLKEHPATKHILIGMMSAHTPTAGRSEAAEAGCDLYLAKPLSPRVLGEQVARLLGGPAAGAIE